jgi:hypothetical protein
METAVESAWECIKHHLECERRRICEEIKTYPRPIPACDVQFNALLEERTGVFEELRLLQKIDFDSAICNDVLIGLHDFVQSSRFLGDEAKQQITTSLLEQASGAMGIAERQMQHLLTSRQISVQQRQLEADEKKVCLPSERDPERVVRVKRVRGVFAHTRGEVASEELHYERQVDKMKEGGIIKRCG